MLFALILIFVIASSGTIFANNMNETAENLFTRSTDDFSVNSFQANNNSVDNINQINNSNNTTEFTGNHYNDSKPVMENTNNNSANDERENSLNEKNQNNIIGNKTNTSVIVDNIITENTIVDKVLSTENVVNLITTQIQTLNNNLSSGMLAAGEDEILFTKSSILNAATNVKKFVERNGKLPNYVTIANQKVSMSDFLYLLSKSILNVNGKNNSDISWRYVKDPSAPSGNTINGNLNKKDYLFLAQNIVKYIEKHGQAPNYGSTSLGKVQFQSMIYGFVKILDFTKNNNGVLPNYLKVNTKSPTNLNKIIPKYNGNNINNSFVVSNISLANVQDAGARVEAFYNTYNVLPNYVTISDKQYSMAEFLYLASTAIVNMKNGINTDILSIAVKNPFNNNGNSQAGEINKESYTDLASRISSYIANNSQAPNYADSSLGKVEFNLLVVGFSKILGFSKTNNVLPENVTLNKSGSVSSSSLNDKYNGESLTSYLVASNNCQVNDGAIKALATELTRGCTTELQKAESIFNYVRDKIQYSFYYNTLRGAKKTLTDRTGNCVDQSHLLIALFRASGLAAKYVNGQAKFVSGNTYGHVWVQVKVGDTWVVADSTSKSNYLGVVNNWYANTVIIKDKYANLPF